MAKGSNAANLITIVVEKVKKSAKTLVDRKIRCNFAPANCGIVPLNECLI